MASSGVLGSKTPYFVTCLSLAFLPDNLRLKCRLTGERGPKNTRCPEHIGQYLTKIVKKCDFKVPPHVDPNPLVLLTAFEFGQNASSRAFFRKFSIFFKDLMRCRTILKG